MQQPNNLQPVFDSFEQQRAPRMSVAMPLTRTYTHLSPEERTAIMLELHHAREDNRPCSIRALARALNRNPSTISRELRRPGDAPHREVPPSPPQSAMGRSIMMLLIHPAGGEPGPVDPVRKP